MTVEERERNRQELAALRAKLEPELSEERIAYVPTAKAFFERVTTIEQRLTALETAERLADREQLCEQAAANAALNEFVTLSEIVGMSGNFNVDDATHIQGVAEAVVRRLKLLKNTVDKY